jgi:hypothetical protein
MHCAVVNNVTNSCILIQQYNQGLFLKKGIDTIFSNRRFALFLDWRITGN